MLCPRHPSNPIIASPHQLHTKSIYQNTTPLHSTQFHSTSELNNLGGVYTTPKHPEDNRDPIVRYTWDTPPHTHPPRRTSLALRISPLRPSPNNNLPDHNFNTSPPPSTPLHCTPLVTTIFSPGSRYRHRALKTEPTRWQVRGATPAAAVDDAAAGAASAASAAAAAAAA